MGTNTTERDNLGIGVLVAQRWTVPRLTDILVHRVDLCSVAITPHLQRLLPIGLNNTFTNSLLQANITIITSFED